MADEIQKLYDLPDVSFIDDITFDQILNENITNWQNEYEQETGKKKILRPGDKEYIQLKIEAGQWFQMYKQLDFAAKQNLLKYSTRRFPETFRIHEKDLYQRTEGGSHNGSFYFVRNPP